MGGSYWVKERVEWNWSALLHALLPTFATAYIRYCCCLHTPPPLLPTSFASRLCRGACGRCAQGRCTRALALPASLHGLLRRHWRGWRLARVV